MLLRFALARALAVGGGSGTLTVSRMFSGASQPEMGDDDAIPKVIFILGPPGSGKGTQCSMITQDTDFVHLSAGDLLRQECGTAGSKYGQLISQRIKDGQIVPVEITCALLERAMQVSDQQHFLIDGFPRNEDNLQGWTKTMGHKSHVLFLLFLQAPEAVCVERILDRGKSSGRTDDNVESLKKRFQTYVQDTLPIVKYYEKQGLVRTVDSTLSPMMVHQNVMRILNESLSQTTSSCKHQNC